MFDQYVTISTAHAVINAWPPNKRTTLFCS